MATAYTSLLGLALPVTGELSGTWGATVNDEITALLDSAVAGTTSITADADITLSDTDGAANETRQAVILWNPATGTTTRNITAPARSKAYIVINASGGTQSIVLRGAGPTTGVTIIKGEKALCAWDGSDFVKVANQNGIGNFTTVDTTNLEVTNLKALDGTAAGSIANSTGVVTLASSVLTTTDINGGTIDGTAIGGSTAAAGSFTTLSATGVTTVQAGTAAAPAITTTGDTNTGIFFGADIIGFAEGGAEVARFNADAQFVAAAGTASLPVITTTGDVNTGIFFPAADTIAFSEGGAEAMRIDSDGDVGIGTNSPGAKLAVVSGTSPNIATLQVGFSGSANYYDANLHSFRNGSQAEVMRIDSGNLLVGTTSGAFRLNVTAATDCAGFALTNGSMLIREVGSTAANNTMEFHLRPNSGKSAYITFTENAIDDRWSVGIQNGNANLRFVTGVGGSGTERMNLSSGGNLTISGATATKASGTTWANPSDQRLKDNIRDYAKGTTELMQVRVREWEYNGKGGTTEGMKGLGVIADEVMTVLPDTVENYDAKLNADDEETTAIKKFDATEITWLLVKTVQEQQALITTLTDRITALEQA